MKRVKILYRKREVIFMNITSKILISSLSLAVLIPVCSFAATSGQEGTNKLIVKGPDGTTDKFVVQSITDNNPGPNFGLQYGFVGIGNNNPISALHAYGTTTQSTQFTSQYISSSDPVVPHVTPVNGGGGFIAMFNYPNIGTAPNYNHPLNGDRLGYFLFGAQMQDGALRNGAGISALAEGDWTNSSVPASFAFQTAPAGSVSRVERFRITSTGNIGANTSAPQATLDVNGSFRINPGNTGAVVVSKPTCSDSIRGTFWFTQGAGQAKDSLQMCASNGTTTDWVTIY